MIQAEVGNRSVVFHADLPAGSVAYVDGAWLPAAGSGEAPALLVTADHTIAWGLGPRVPTPEGTDPDEAAAAALVAVAEDAAAHARGAGRHEVVGNGMIALLVRTLLAGPEPTAPAARPGAIVDTTGDPAEIASALEHVADLGTLVLAGECLGRQVDLDLYRTVHLRGLTLVGVPPPLVAEIGPENRGALAAPNLIAECRDALVIASSGRAAAGGAAWYRVSVA